MLKNSAHLVLIQKTWLERYEEESLLTFHQPLDAFLPIDDFIDNQKSRIRKMKDLIINEWTPLLSKIYRDQISALNRNQAKCELFFDSCAVFLAMQIRALIQKSMDAYLQFLRTYDVEILNPPDTVVYL